MAHPDFEELLAAFDAHKVRYLIGGAHAVALHPRPRATKDLDLYLAATRANARRVIRAVAEFFGGTAPSYISVENLLDPDMLIQLGVAPVRVDLLHEPETVPFAVASRRRVCAPFGRVQASFLSLPDLIAENVGEALREHRVPIVDQAPDALEKAIGGVGQIPPDLLDPRTIHLVSDAADMDLTGLDIDHEEHEVPDEACHGEGLHSEEVRRADGSQVLP